MVYRSQNPHQNVVVRRSVSLHIHVHTCNCPQPQQTAENQKKGTQTAVAHRFVWMEHFHFHWNLKRIRECPTTATFDTNNYAREIWENVPTKMLKKWPAHFAVIAFELLLKQETKVFISRQYQNGKAYLSWIQTGGGGHLNPTFSQPQYML